MNIADYFKSKSDKPIDALIEEILKDDSNSVNIKQSQDKTELDVMIDNILGKDEPLSI
jgi:hypothetical protein